MAEDTVASLGFAVDSSGLDKAKQSLSGVTAEAQKTEQQASKTSEALSKVGGGNAGAGLANAAKSADQLAASLVKAASEAQKALNVTQAMETIVAKTGVTFAQAATSIKLASEAKAKLAAEAAKAAPALAAVERSAAGMSTTLAGVTGSLNLSGLGILAVAAAAAGLSKAIIDAGDEMLRAKNNFSALTGSAKEGERAYNAVQAAAKASGVEFNTLASALQKAQQGQNLIASTSTQVVDAVGRATERNVIYANTAERVTNFNNKLADTFSTLGRAMQNAGATADEEKTVFSALADSIGKTGTLTTDAFQRIRDSSLPTARAISNAFGFKDINEFQAQLARTPITVQQLIDRVNQIKPAIDAAFDPNKPQTLEQATRELGAEWHRLLKTMAETGVFSGVASAIGGVTKALATAAAAASQLSQAISSIKNGGGPNPAGGVGQSMSDASVSGGQGGANYGGYLYPSGDAGTITDLSNVTDGGAFASGGSFVVGGAGGTDSQTVTFKATPGEVVSVSTADQAASGIASLTPVLGAGSNLEDLFDEQTKEIVDAINSLGRLLRGGASSAVATGVNAASGPSGVTRGSNLGPMGGGLIGGGDAKTKADAQRDNAENADQSGPRLGGVPLPGGLIAGQGNTIKGSKGASEFPSRVPINPDFTEAIKDGTYKTKNAIDRGTARTDRGLDDVEAAGKGTTSAVDSAGQEITSAVTDGWGKVSEALDSGLSQLGSMIAGAMSNQGGSGGGAGGGWNGGGGYDASGNFTGGSSGGYSGGSDYVSSYPMPSDSGGSGYIPDSSGGFDPGAINYGGGEVDAGYFADGGTFKVPGAGNADTTRIKMHAKPGETVTVTPVGVNVSPLMLNPSAEAGVNFAGYKPKQPDGSVKTVHMHLYGVTDAQSFLKSRAQIERAA